MTGGNGQRDRSPASQGQVSASAAESRDHRVRRTVCYSGRVQGVGFRATTCAIAARFAVTGTVRNLPDGRVELVAEGAPDELDRFLAELHAEMSAYIRDTKCSESPAVGSLSGFHIIH